MRTSKLIFVVGIVLALLRLTSTAPAGELGYTGEYVGVAPEIIVHLENTTVDVKLRNTGLSTFFQMEVLSIPAGWAGVNNTPQAVFLNNDQVGNFKVTLFAGGNPGPATFRVRFFVYDNLTFPVFLFDQDVSITSMAPPAAFSVLAPTPGMTLSETFLFQWEQSQGADVYDLRIVRAGTSQVAYQQLNITSVSWLLNIDENLEQNTGYSLTVTARNAVGSRTNNGGIVSFQTRPHPPLGAFTINFPTPDLLVPTRPTVTWTASENATSYNFLLFPDDNGLPGLPAFREVTGITSTFYTWTDPELAVGRYHARVVANGAAGTLANQNGPIPFRVTELSNFQLLEPTDGETLVPRNKRFQWTGAEGAEFYTIEIFQELGDRRASVYADTFPAPLGLVNYDLPIEYALNPGQQHSWRVTAFTSQESRVNDGGDKAFTVTPLIPFDLLSPVSGASDVEPVPAFDWADANGGTAYLMELAPALEEGGVDLENIMRSSSPITDSSWTSTFAALERGREHYWRVAATDGKNVAYNVGQWRPFSINPLTAFSLDFPSDNVTDYPVDGVFTWTAVPLAEGYRVIFDIPGVRELPPIDVPAGQTVLNLAGRGLHLNGDMFYRWKVVAFAGENTLTSTETRTLRTEPRLEANACDILDHVIGSQELSTAERASVGAFTLLDIANYYQYLQFPDSVECDR